MQKTMAAVEAMERREAKKAALQTSADARTLGVQRQPVFKAARGDTGARRGATHWSGAGVGAPGNELPQDMTSIECACTTMHDSLSEFKRQYVQLSEGSQGNAASPAAPVAPTSPVALSSKEQECKLSSSASPPGGVSEQRLQILVAKIMINTLPHAILQTSHVPKDAPTFTPLSRRGGNHSKTSVCDKVLRVALDKDNIAMWEPCHLYQKRMDATKTFLHSPASELRLDVTGILHPVLRISRAFVSKQSKALLVNDLFGHTGRPEKQFGQFLCEIGMRSSERGDGVIWRFDPEAWNRMGHRIIAGRAAGGGKPTIVYV